MSEGSDGSARGLWYEAWDRLRGDRVALAAGAILALAAILALLGPLLSPYPYDKLDWQHVAVPPRLAASHWLGTDRLGRDLYVRTLYGVRISLVIGVIATLVSVLVGVVWGATAGYVGGRTDAIMMRFVDVLASLPYLFLVITLAALFGRGNPYVLFVGIGAVGWITMAPMPTNRT